MATMTEIREMADREELPFESEEGTYQSLSVMAIVGLFLGAASTLALLSLAFFFVPLVAIAVNAKALRNIAEPSLALTGRRLAFAGLLLSLVFGISGLLQPWLFEFSMQSQSLETARQWFEAVRANQPELAHQLTKPIWIRNSSVGSLPKVYASGQARADLDKYLKEPAVKWLFSLGKEAHVRLHQQLGVVSNDLDDTDRVKNAYAVTIAEKTEPVTYLVEVESTRRLDLLSKTRSWFVTSARFITSPPGIDGDASQATGEPTGPQTIQQKLQQKLDAKQQSSQ
jgi:hypothetical protein